MDDDYHAPQDDKEFNPWPFLNRIAGLILAALGMFWLSSFQGPVFLGSKLMLVTAGGLWGTGFRQMQTGRIRLQFWLALVMIPTGFALGYIGLEPRVLNKIIIYTFGGLALIFGGRSLTLKK